VGSPPLFFAFDYYKNRRSEYYKLVSIPATKKPKLFYTCLTLALFILPLSSILLERNLRTKGGNEMLWTIAVILFVLWLLGMVSSYTLSGFIHILLVLAIIAVLVGFFTGRRTV
jgi:hypothetical protein